MSAFASGVMAIIQKIHLINWNCIRQSKNAEGLGLQKAADMNKSLLAKLHWRMRTKQDKAWRKVTRAKYDVNKLIEPLPQAASR